MRVICRAYVVHGKGVKGEEARKFAKEVQKWIEPKVAKHKYLRGGVVVTDSIPKRYDSSHTVHSTNSHGTRLVFTVLQERSSAVSCGNGRRKRFFQSPSTRLKSRRSFKLPILEKGKRNLSKYICNNRKLIPAILFVLYLIY